MADPALPPDSGPRSAYGEYGTEPPLKRTVLCDGGLHRYCDGDLVWFTASWPDPPLMLSGRHTFLTKRHVTQCRCHCHPFGPLVDRIYEATPSV